MHWLDPRNFTKSEWAWISGFGVIVSILSTLPYIIFYSLTPAHQQYQWASVFYYDDYFQYYAWARHIAAGEWLIRNYYTDNPQASFALFNPYFLMLGWTTRLTGNVYAASHLLRIIGIIFFSYMSYAFPALFLKQPRERMVAQLLFFAGGLEYPYYLFSTHVIAALPDHLPTSLADPYVFKVLYRYGHLTVALCIVLFIFGTYLSELSKGKDSKNSLAALACIGFAVAILGLINPYYLVLIGSVIALHALYQIIKSHSPRARICKLLAAVGLGSLLPALHYAAQPIIMNLGSISFDDPINVGDFILFFGLFIPFVVMDLRDWKRGNATLPANDRSLFLLMWIAAALLIILTPLAFKARMTFALQINLAIWIAPRLVKTGFLRARYWPLYGLMLSEIVFSFYKESVDFNRKGVGRLDRSVLAAYEFINDDAKNGDIVLTSADLGFYLPAFSLAHTFVGHSFQTDNYYEKDKAVMGFFTMNTAAEREKFLAGTNAKYVLLAAPAMTATGRWKLDHWPKVYGRYGYQIYKRPEHK